MNGKLLISIFLIFLTIFTLLLFYFQNFAYYETLEVKQDISIENNVLEIMDYNGIDSNSSGLKLRECFVVDKLNIEGLKRYENPTPLKAPFWFSCFDAKIIEKDLSANKAVAFLSKKEEFDGIDKVIALYPDGRGYQWRQLNEKYTDK